MPGYTAENIHVILNVMRDFRRFVAFGVFGINDVVPRQFAEAAQAEPEIALVRRRKAPPARQMDDKQDRKRRRRRHRSRHSGRTKSDSQSLRRDPAHLRLELRRRRRRSAAVERRSRRCAGSRSIRPAMAASTRAGNASQSIRSHSIQRPSGSRTNSPRSCMVRRSSTVNSAWPRPCWTRWALTMPNCGVRPSRN